MVGADQMIHNLDDAGLASVVTHQEICLSYPRATFPWYLVSTRHIDDIDYVVC
jgi:hypothetical protein